MLMRPVMTFYRRSDEVSTLKENAINALHKELTQSTKQYRFKTQAFGIIFEQKLNQVNSEILDLAKVYGLEANTLGLFDKVYRIYAMNNLREFVCDVNDNSDRIGRINVGTKCKNLTDSNLEHEILAHNFEESMESFELKMKYADLVAYICLRLVMKFEENQ